MQRFVPRLFALGVLCAGSVFGQGTFGQIAFGGCYVTTFTLVNMSPGPPSGSTAQVSLSFYMDNGTPLSAPIQGVGSMTSYAFAIPAGGAQNVVLTTTNTTTVEGWASLSRTGPNFVEVRGQAVYRCAIAGRPTYEAVVPLSTGPTECIIAFPPTAAPVILMPYDNTAGLHTTSVAIANITNAAISVAIEFDDQNDVKVASDTLNLGALAHTAFDSTANYKATVGTQGVLRISASTSSVTPVGFLFNPSGAFTTIIPITQ